MLARADIRGLEERGPRLSGVGGVAGVLSGRAHCAVTDRGPDGRHVCEKRACFVLRKNTTDRAPWSPGKLLIDRA